MGQLADEAAHVDERVSRVLRRSALGVAAVLVAAVCVGGLGLLSTCLDSLGGTTDAATHTVQYDFDLVNRGPCPVSVAGVSTNLPGVIVTSTSQVAGDEVLGTLRDCGAVSSNVRPPHQSWIGDLVLYACGQEPR